MGENAETRKDQERLTDAIQGCTAFAEETRDLTGAVVVGWLVIAEWMDPAGQKWLTRLGNEGSTAWQRKGYLAEYMYSDEQEG